MICKPVFQKLISIMAPSKQVRRAENNSSPNIDEINNLSELYTLKENNRDLAKLLADKRKENSELKEIEQKYIVLESKFKMHREIHQSSLSKLEEMFQNTCSQLTGVVENLTSLYAMLKEERDKIHFMMDESNDITSSHVPKQLSPTLPQSLRIVSSFLNDVNKDKVQESEDKVFNVSPQLGEQLCCSISTIDEGHENIETISGNNSLPNNSHLISPIVNGSLNTSFTETYHISFDERFKSFVVDDETIVRRGGGSPIITVDSSTSTSTQEKILNSSDSVGPGGCTYTNHKGDDSPSNLSNFKSAADTVPLRTISARRENENRCRNTSNRNNDVIFESNLRKLLYPHAFAQVSKSPAHYSPREIRNKLGNSLSISCQSNTSFMDMPENKNDIPSRSVQYFNQSHRRSDRFSEMHNTSANESRNSEENAKETIFYNDPQISFHRYRYHITMGTNASSSNDRYYDGKENMTSFSHSKSNQKIQTNQCQMPRKPLHERRSDTIIISNQTIKKSSPIYTSQSTSPEKRTWLRGPRNFDTDMVKQGSYSSFRSLKHFQDAGESSALVNAHNSQNKRSRRKTRIKKKENIRL